MTDDPNSVSTRAFHRKVAGGDVRDIASALDDDPSLASAKHEGMSPLLLSLFAGHDAVADLLVERGAGVDMCEAGALGSIEHLERCDSRDDANALGLAGALGWTPLHLAAFLGRIEAARWLLSRGADTRAVSHNEEANTPLHAALAGRAEPDVVRLLLEWDADPNGRGGLGVTPLHLAASRGDLESVDTLVQHGARTTAMDDGRTPSDLARERGHDDVAAKLGGIERE